MPYAGQTFYIYFNVWNDANNVRTWMYLDDVELYACAPVMPLSLASPQVQAMPTAIPPPPTPILPTAAPATETQPPPSPTPVALIELPTFTPLPTATTAGVLVVIVTETPAPPVDFATSDLFRPPEVSVDVPVAEEPSLLNRLGTIAILLTIIVIILFLVAAIANRLRTTPDA
jgi:hypothetical protein